MKLSAQSHASIVSSLQEAIDKFIDRKSRVGKECRSRWSPYH